MIMDLSDNSSDRCRVCLNDDVLKLFDWHTPVLELDDQQTYAEIFRQCTQLEVEGTCNDCLPQVLCFICGSELRAVYDFIQKAYRSDQALRLKGEEFLTATETKAGDVPFEWVVVLKEDIDESACSSNEVPRRVCSVEEKFTVKESESENNLYEISELNDCDNNDKCKPLEAEQGNCEKVTASKRVNNRRLRCRSTKINSHNRSELDEQQPSCEYCHESFPQKQLKRHISRYHEPNLVLCHACPRTFKNATSLRAHALTHEENRERNFPCELCGRKFYTHNACQAHTHTHDANRKSRFQCDQCEKSFFHKGSLTLHRQNHTGKTIECKICAKRYLRKVDLKIHMRSHSGDTPYKCPHCDKGFTQVGILNKHVLHHEGFRYKCDVCGKEYLHQSTLIQHRKEHTGLPLKCSLCDKGFVKKSKMRRHIKGVHKVSDLAEMEKLIIKVKTKKEYRGRILESC